MANKTKQILTKALQLIISILSLFYIVDKVSDEKDQLGLIISFLSEKPLKIIFLSVALIFLFSFSNWSLEFIKWKKAISHIRKLTFLEASKQSLIAHSVAIITPQRVGDYVTKLIFFKKEYRKKVLLANFRTAYTQMFITVLLGVVALIYFAYFYDFKLNFTYVLSAALLIVLFLMILYFFKFSVLQQLKSIFTHKPKQLISLINLSFVKHLIFSHQYYFLISFIAEVNYLDAMMAINLMYLFASVLPSFFILDFAIKGSIGIFIFSHLGVSATLISLVSFLMWFLSFALPAIIGSIILNCSAYPKTIFN